VLHFPRRPDLILLIEGRNYSPSQFLEQITLDFDQLYDEAGRRRRMMSVSAHDRISGTPQMVGSGTRSCATPRAGRAWRSCARTRSPPSCCRAPSPCARAKRSDRSAHPSLGMAQNWRATCTTVASPDAISE
jgi:hypothetical protein